MHPTEYAALTPGKPALIYPARGFMMDYATLEAQSNQGAHLLRELGLKRGDVIAMLFGNGPEVFITSWAAQRSGLYATSISNRLSAPDVAYIIQDSGARLLIVADELADLAQAALAEVPNPPPAFLWNSRSTAMQSWQERASTMPRTPIADESAGTDMLYSSGTTGRPKGVKPALPEGPIGEGTPLTRMGTGLYRMRSEERRVGKECRL